LRVLDDVVLGGARSSGDQTDATRQERQRTFAASNSPSAASSLRSSSRRASNAPMPTGLMSTAANVSVPRAAQ
jgi:hypothetical protein